MFKSISGNHRQLLTNLASLMGGEGVHRISRLICIMLVARALGVEAYGAMVFVALCHESFRCLSKLSGGSLIIQCQQSDLAWVCANSARLNAFIAIVTATLQFCLADFISRFFDQTTIADLLKVLSLTHLIYPFVMVQVNLLHRQQHLKKFALLSTICVVVEDLSCALFAVILQSAWCVVLAKSLSAVLWCILFYRFGSERPEAIAKWSRMPQLLNASVRIFSSELSKQLRSNCDIFIAARLLGPEAFGLYSFAKNAAIGIAQSISNAYLHALYPYIAKLIQQGSSLSALSTSIGLVGLISLLFIVQSFLAPFYVPIVFGEKWSVASSIVSILCLASVALLFTDTCLLFFRCQSNFTIELLGQVFALAFIAFSLQQFDSPAADQFAEHFVFNLSIVAACLLGITLIVFTRHYGGQYEIK